MTERPISSECRKRLICAAIAVCIMMAAGCLGQQGLENRTENVTPNNIPVPQSPIQEQPSQKPVTVLSSDNFWIAVDPIGTVYKNNVTVSGTTNLPEGEILEIWMSAQLARSMPSYYDYSHETASAETTVIWINATIRGFTSLMDVTKLNPGKYDGWVQSQRNHSIYGGLGYGGFGFNLLPAQSSMILEHTDYIYAKCSSLPPLNVNGSMEPVLISGNVALVPPDLKKQSNQIPYGAIMLFSEDGIDRIFNENGTQIAALYDSNELHLWQVPGGASIKETGNITTIYLDEKKILTKIYEIKPCA